MCFLVSHTVYYCGRAADEIKKYAEAVTYFDIAIQKKFNIGNAYARKAKLSIRYGIIFSIECVISFFFNLVRVGLCKNVSNSNLF